MNRQSCATEFVDGKLALLTNTPDLTPTETFKHYEALADIECGFRVLNSDIEIASVHRQVAGSHPRTCADLLSRIRAQPRHADAPKNWRT